MFVEFDVINEDNLTNKKSFHVSSITSYKVCMDRPTYGPVATLLFENGETVDVAQTYNQVKRAIDSQIELNRPKSNHDKDDFDPLSPFLFGVPFWGAGGE